MINQSRLTDLVFTVQEAESGQRGYLLTGDPSYLDAYNAAVANLPADLPVLNAIAIDRPNAADSAAMRAVIAKKMAELAKTVELYGSGNAAAALALVHTNIGANDMRRLRALAAQIQLRQSSDRLRMQATLQRDDLELIAVTLLGVIGTLLLAWVALRDSRNQTGQLLAATSELDRIFKLSSDLIAVMDFDGKFTSVNPAWQTITGWLESDAISRPYSEFIHPDDVAGTAMAFDTIQSGGAVVDFENRCRRPDGSYCWLSWRSVPLADERRLYCIARDVTEEKMRDEQLRQSQKMEVIGQLTGGIAHDFNNLLTIVMGSLELLQRGLANADAKTARRIDTAMDGARRAAALTHRLLAFARRQPLQPHALDLNKTLTGMAELLHRVLDAPIELEFVTAAGLWRVMADGHQLENSILNLAVNARDAMPAGGRLTIETGNVFLDEAYIAADAGAGVPPGQYAMIAVSDTGVGMTADVRGKVFEPFFTTKSVGQGTGLGLAQVYGFIKQSNGHIKIYSEVGQGTTVKLYLPRLRTLVAEAPRPVTENVANLIGAGETILVVEDEEKVRNFTVEVLQEYGYHVIGVENAAPALEIMEGGQAVDLLFTDVILTGSMNGRHLADAVLERWPGTPVLFTTGYTRNAIIHHGRLDEGINFIGKPFTASALAQTVRRILDRPRVGDAVAASGDAAG